MPSTTSDSSKLLVCLRVRPMNDMERNNNGAFECISVVDRKRLLLVDPDKFSADPLRQNRAQEREFRYDAIFGPNATESEVQELLGAEGLVDSLVRLGRNGTVLAYGPTGTGKTHTMVGNADRPGLMTQMTRALYERLEEMGDKETRVYISFMEIYNELIRDLLNPERNATPLDLLEDEQGNVQVPSLSRVRAPNTDRILQLLQEGNSRRTQEPTAANATSSRSHALLQISLRRGQRQRGKLFLIDLAGSERASHTQNQGQRLKEGAAINRSLLALGNVINALSSTANSNGAAGGTRRRTFVNFRDSKLTRLLKDSLAGAAEGARTVLIAHVTPSSLHYDESFNTLTYASRARRIDLRLGQPPRRPASADRPYSDALATLRREAQRAAGGGGLDTGHAASTGQLADDTESSTNSGRGGRGGQQQRGSGTTLPPAPTMPPLILATNNAQSPANINRQRATKSHGPTSVGQVKLPRIGSTLFDSLREQHLASGERQQRLRDRLLRANTEAFELEMGRQTRNAILEAYQEQQKQRGEGGGGEEEGEKGEKLEKMVEKIRMEMAGEEGRLSELAETRQKIETALRRGEQNMRTLEGRMRNVAKNAQEQQMVELLQTLAKQQAERTAIHSNFAIQNRRIRRQESQMNRIRRYERVADRLITGKEEMDDEERTNLYREYRILRGQLSKVMMPIETGLPSWNAQIVQWMDRRGSEERRKSESRTNDFNKTFIVHSNGGARAGNGGKSTKTGDQQPELMMSSVRKNLDG